MLEQLLNKVKTYHPGADADLIELAYMYASRAHAGQVRASGEPFFNHAYNVALILSDLKMDERTLAAALLHDVLEDTPVKPADLSSEFGTEIAALVEGVTKINAYHFTDREIAQAENWRKMLLAVTRDARVILIKLADRLHNMSTIRFLSPEKQREIASESLYLYAPFAQRLGIYRWKSELEDMSFEILFPDDYRVLHDAWEQRQESRQHQLERWRSLLDGSIASSGLAYRLSIRPKSLYGIHKKMERQRKPFSEIQDLIGMRLVTDTVENCYALLGIVHSTFRPVPGAFTDYIQMPKINMYQSLHTSIYGPDDVIAELQIRTEEMHRRAEYGIAAHWRYKEAGGVSVAHKPGAKEDIEARLDWLKQMLSWQDDIRDVREFMQAFRVECNFEQVFVFTPGGKVIKLPQGATPIDFAFAVHSAIGYHCYGARVGGKIQPLNYVLKTGETCEILTRKSAHPATHWLSWVITARARAKIRRYLHEQDQPPQHAGGK